MLDACETIVQRLAPHRLQNPNATFKEVYTKVKENNIKMRINQKNKYIKKSKRRRRERVVSNMYVCSSR